MILRKMQDEDLESVLLLEKELFAASAWDKNFYLYELHDNVFASYYVLENLSQIIGYIGFWIIYDQCQITTIGVAKAKQGNRYSYLLLDKCLLEANLCNCCQITLEVRVSNQAAIHVYQKYGFQKVAIRKQYYENNEDAYLMLKESEVNI